MKAAIAALFIAFVAQPQAAKADLKIDGTGIDVSTSADLTGDWLESGTVHWDAATNTLTLNNVTLVSKNNPFNFYIA